MSQRSSGEILFSSQLVEHEFPPWEEEYKFLKDRRFRFDFAWPQSHIAVEIEGGTWSGGRHSRGAGFERDCEKYNLATREHWKVYRFTSAMVKDYRGVVFLESVWPFKEGNKKNQTHVGMPP